MKFAPRHGAAGSGASVTWLALCLLTLLALPTLASCSESGPYAPPPASVKKLPTYPGAQQPQVTPTVLYPDIPSETITFRTSDTPDTVLAFYRDTLVTEGWELSNYHPLDAFIRFVWDRGCPLYYVDVLTKAEKGARTEVKVKTAVDLCL